MYDEKGEQQTLMDWTAYLCGNATLHEAGTCEMSRAPPDERNENRVAIDVDFCVIGMEPKMRQCGCRPLDVRKPLTRLIRRAIDERGHPGVGLRSVWEAVVQEMLVPNILVVEAPLQRTLAYAGLQASSVTVRALMS